MCTFSKSIPQIETTRGYIVKVISSAEYMYRWTHSTLHLISFRRREEHRPLCHGVVCLHAEVTVGFKAPGETLKLVLETVHPPTCSDQFSVPAPQDSTKSSAKTHLYFEPSVVKTSLLEKSGTDHWASQTLMCSVEKKQFLFGESYSSLGQSSVHMMT